MIPKTIIHLLSGGLDSVTMLYYLHEQGHNIHCLMFDYGQKHSQELLLARHHCNRIGLLHTCYNMQQLKGSSLTDDGGGFVVPFRNPIMLSVAINVAVAAGADTITIGCNANDNADFPDCRREFLDAFNATVKACGYNVEVCAPFIDKYKWEIGGMARNYGIKSSDIWTCYQGGAKPCGECPACKKLKEAMP